MSSGLAITGTGLVDGTFDAEGYGLAIDPNRLRRMDRFGRLGFLAGSLALRESDAALPGDIRDPARSGIVFGTAFGCRDSVTDHARLVAATTRSDELRPALFAQTVHNAVNGELAIAWGLGGLSEVIVSGRCAGLEALLMGASFLQDSSLERVVVGGGEGLHAEMERAWREERPRYGPAAERVEPHEAAAALVLSPVTIVGRGFSSLDGGTLFFEPDPRDAAERLALWMKTREASGERLDLSVATADLEPDFLRALRQALGDGPWTLRPRATAAGRELFGASGAVGAVEAVRRIRSGETDAAFVVARDPDGPTAAVLLTRGESS